MTPIADARGDSREPSGPVLDNWLVSSWQEFVDAAPEFASAVEALVTAHKHHTMATLREDGSPRISAAEVDLDDGQLCLGTMQGTVALMTCAAIRALRAAVKASPLRSTDPGAWSGEAKLDGRAIDSTHAPTGRVIGSGVMSPGLS